MKENSHPKWLIELFEWLKALVIVFISVFLISNFIIVNANIPTSSMHNTMMTNDRVIAFRLSYLFSLPERCDVVVFKFPDNEKLLYTKRIIGLPGDIVEIIDGDVYINHVLNEEVNAHVSDKPVGNFGPYFVPEDSYFMMGDNRNMSQDSRFWMNPFVTKDKIEGKVIFRYWPNIAMIR